MNNNNQAQEDFAMFTQPPPEVAEARKKKLAEEVQSKKKAETALRPEQLKAAAALSESMKAEQEAEEKSKLIAQLHDYLKLIKEYHPERTEFIRVPKTFGVKNTCEELRVWIKDCQQELGKKGGLDTVKMMWVEGFKFWEKINEGGRFGLVQSGIGQVATNSIMPRQMQDGTIVPGPAVPTLAEFAVKHSNWFSSSVEARMAMMVLEMVAGVHRMNTQQDMNVAKAAATPVSKDTKEKMDAL